jgi:hypothetical protein
VNSRYYLYAGLRIASELPLPEWLSFEQPEMEATDIAISLGEIPDSESLVAGRRIVTDSECQFAVPGVGSFRISHGREIIIQKSGKSEPRQLRQWLLGSAWGALCYQRGLFLIHASAVVVDAHAVLFCAPSRGGKSTLAATLDANGYSLISDDLCHIAIPEAGSPTLFPSAPRFKLWADALQTLESRPECLELDPLRAGKFHVTRTGTGQTTPATLRDIYLLEWGDLNIGRLSGATALRRFWSASTYRPRMLASAEQLGWYSSQSLSVLQRVPVWELTRPRDLQGMSKTVDLLASHWANRRIISK